MALNSRPVGYWKIVSSAATSACAVGAPTYVTDCFDTTVADSDPRSEGFAETVGGIPCISMYGRSEISTHVEVVNQEAISTYGMIIGTLGFFELDSTGATVRTEFYSSYAFYGVGIPTSITASFNMHGTAAASLGNRIAWFVYVTPYAHGAGSLAWNLRGVASATEPHSHLELRQLS